MLETLSKGFRNARLKLQGKTMLSEDNISEALRDVRVSLLEADVYHVLDRVVDVRHERYQGEACAAAHVVTAAQASAKPHMHMHMHMHVHIRSTHNAGGSC